jgi:membrane protein insertase Oxa1/YidC/SpoIIIJ
LNTFIIKVQTYKQYKNATDFAANLEDIKPWFYNHKEEVPEEAEFKKVIVLETTEIFPFGG